MTDRYKKEFEAWKAKTSSWLQKHPEREKDFLSISNRKVDRLYAPEEAAEVYSKKLGFPGEYPYTRGIYPTMYRGRLWTMRQFAGFGTARDTNKRFHYLLDHGQTGLSTAFHFPTLMGYDSDSPRARGEVGVCGVALGLSALSDQQWDDLHELYVKIDEDLADALVFANTANFSIAGPYLESRLKMAFERAGVEGRADHAAITAKIKADLVSNKTNTLGEGILEAARIRGFLG